MGFQMSAIGVVCATLLAACGGGGGGSDGGAVQSISFPFAGGGTVSVPPAVTTTTLRATASSGGPITYTSETPAVCSVSGSTLSLLKAGECAVTARQAGFEGYAAVSQRQLFVVPKLPQMIVFRNPGAQPLDTQPVALSATTGPGRAVTFASSTPSVCTVSGSALTKLANGLCTVTGTQDGDDIYEKAAVVRNIPIGTEQAPALTFTAGFKDATTTREGGTIEGFAGTSENGWWCNGACEQAASGDGGSLTFTFKLKLDHPSGGAIGGYYSLGLYAAGLKELSKSGPTAVGVRIDSQATMKFTIAQNAEWLSAGNNGVSVDLVLGHFVVKADGKPCNVALRAKAKPVDTTATAFSLGLKDFTIGEACELSDLNAWNELQDYPIAKVGFSADSMNTTVSSTPADKPTYTTQLTLTGPITFQ
ncbi:MAG TPA: hypothetical protein VF616_06400 [Duganella sp.]|uniref:hypothetical protein n=1 Tax=Duganella sp. TaxID=1904440 RepID=UPI002ED5C884